MDYPQYGSLTGRRLIVLMNVVLAASPIKSTRRNILILKKVVK